MKFLPLVICILASFSIKREFKKNYYPSGSKKSEGWVLAGKMHDYWTFFYEDGAIASKGHFNKGAKNGYWFYYDKLGNKTKEGHYTKNQPTQWWVYYYGSNYENCLYQPDGITRFCLTYENGKVSKAKKYVNDIFLQQWTSILSFKHDNPNFSF